MADTDDIVETEEVLAQRRRATRKAIKQRRVSARENFNAERMGSVDPKALRSSLDILMSRDAEAAEDDDDASMQPGPLPAAAPPPLAVASSNNNRWVPIGPTVVRRGQAEDRPQVSGRVRDLQVSNDGLRAYAATAKGGIWYTSNGGATWEPVGGWMNEPRQIGGHTSAFSSGCLLASFGAGAANEFVMVGTGESGAFQGSANAAPMRGMGILVGSAPSTQGLQANPWETATGINQFEGMSIVRMVRVPGSNAGQNNDRVIAAAQGRRRTNFNNISGGLFLGTRTVAGGNSSFAWVALNAPPVPPSPPARAGLLNPMDPTDLLYVGTNLFACYRHLGVAMSINNGNSFQWIPLTFNVGLPAVSVLVGRLSMAVNDDGTAIYVLGEVDTAPGVNNPAPPAPPKLIPHVWQIANPTGAAPVAVPLGGVPTNNQLWGTQRDYDQAIEVTTYTQTNPLPPPPVRIDRVYIAGSLFGAGLVNWNGSIWAFDVAGNALVPAPGISDQPAGVNHGANTAGFIGNAVHPDVHALRKATNPDGTRQIWVACDGGVFASLRDGQTNTFMARNNSLASIEAVFVANHPSSSHFSMLGCQDNGRQVRVGETVWELKTTMQGDGGGVLFHPVRSELVLGQFAQGSWAADPATNFRPPLVAPGGNPPPPDHENAGSQFYSGIAAITQAAPNRTRIALGTNRVWLSDNIGTGGPNTWRVLPITAAGVFVAARDPRPGSRVPSNAANQLFGVPLPPAAIAAGSRSGGLGGVVTVKWVNPTTLLALYTQGVVRYTESPVTAGMWTSTILLQPVMAAPPAPFVIPGATIFTDLEPVPGTNDFYITGTGQLTAWEPAVPATPIAAGLPAIQPTLATDTCYYFDGAAGNFRTTGLGQALPPPAGSPPGTASPIDPAYSVVVDPANINNVYVGTVTAVWISTKVPVANTHGAWNLHVNGLPESTVQDLSIWTDPAAGANSPRLLRAALQSRGIWEVDLARAEPPRTYLRVHARDDRRMMPSPLKNPRRRATARDISPTVSPDISIRPLTPVVNTPSFGGSNLINGALPYQLWTFQTAFRWLSPSVIPNGLWTDQFGDLVERFRRAGGMSGTRRVDSNLWNNVMAAAVDENGNPAVYRAPWQNALAPTIPASEVDIMDTVLPRRFRNNIWQTYRERSLVDVLLHHRDTRPVAASGAGVVLLWLDNRSSAVLTAENCDDIPAFAQSQFTATPDVNPPGNWNVVPASDGTALHRLNATLAARTPRAVSIELDLSGITTGHRVMLLAIAGSTVDPFTAPVGATDRVDNFVRGWPHAAARLISCWSRPGTQLH